MWSVLAVIALAGSINASAPPLESRSFTGPPFVIADTALLNFDLYELRSELRLPVTPEVEAPHSVFRLRHHVGISGGYDQRIVHGSVGFYITVAEIGRWNMGVPSPAIGLIRYQTYDRYRGSFAKTEMSVILSLASVHFRGGYLQSLRKNWYITFEQVYDARSNINGSQFGVSFSK